MNKQLMSRGKHGYCSKANGDVVRLLFAALHFDIAVLSVQQRLRKVYKGLKWRADQEIRLIDIRIDNDEKQIVIRKRHPAFRQRRRGRAAL
jgi:hypothetical protein